MRALGITYSLTVAIWGFASTAWSRDVLLNGQDISSARNQEMKGVNVRIDEKGNVFIDAPHYKVHEEDTYTPLSRFIREGSKDSAKESGPAPKHLGARALRTEPANGSAQPQLQDDLVPASPEIPEFGNQTGSSNLSNNDDAMGEGAAQSLPAAKAGSKNPVKGRKTAALGKAKTPSSPDPSVEENSTEPASQSVSLNKAGTKLGQKESPQGGVQEDSSEDRAVSPISDDNSQE